MLSVATEMRSILRFSLSLHSHPPTRAHPLSATVCPTHPPKQTDRPSLLFTLAMVPLSFPYPVPVPVPSRRLFSFLLLDRTTAAAPSLSAAVPAIALRASDGLDTRAGNAIRDRGRWKSKDDWGIYLVGELAVGNGK